MGILFTKPHVFLVAITLVFLLTVVHVFLFTISSDSDSLPSTFGQSIGMSGRVKRNEWLETKGMKNSLIFKSKEVLKMSVIITILLFYFIREGGKRNGRQAEALYA